MVVCPVCEHTQAASDVCEVCGKALASAVPIAPPAASPVEGLDTGRWEEPFPEDAPPMEGVERTSAVAVGAVDVATVPDIDLGRAEAVGPKVAAPSGPLVCRYCKHPQAEGLLCEQCGMRLPRVARAPPPARGGLDDVIRCKRCGEKVTAGTRCRGCGEPSFAQT